jgi:hypothetical protein
MVTRERLSLEEDVGASHKVKCCEPKKRKENFDKQN